MGLVGHALAGEHFSPPASDAERSSSSSRALTSPRPDGRRDGRTQPVAILRIARFWPSLQRPAGARGHRRCDARWCPGRPGRPIGLEALVPRPRPRRRPALGLAGRAALRRLAGASSSASRRRNVGGGGAADRRRDCRRLHRISAPSHAPDHHRIASRGDGSGRHRRGHRRQGRRHPPVTLSLAAGGYEIQLGRTPDARRITVDIAAGSSVVQHLEMAARAGCGCDRCAPHPDRAVEASGPHRWRRARRVAVDGGRDRRRRARNHRQGPGRSDSPKRHRAASRDGVADRLVGGRPGRQGRGGGRVAQRVVAGAAAAPRRRPDHRDDRIGSPDAAGRGSRPRSGQRGARVQRAAQRVHVNAGKTTTTRIDVPNGTMSLNAAPWAEVFVDGERVGETPIGNLSRPIGRHEVIFRHPQLGERHETVVVTLQGTARLGVDLQKEVGPCAGCLPPFVSRSSLRRSRWRGRSRPRTPCNISRICTPPPHTRTRWRS